LKLLRPVKSGIVTINGNELLAEQEIPAAVRTILKKLNSGHLNGKLRSLFFIKHSSIVEKL
jgi:hypothetical protein